MKAPLIQTTFLLILLCDVKAAPRRTASNSNAMTVSNAKVQKESWGLPHDQEVDSALHRSDSYEEVLRMRATNFAYREIEASTRKTPKTELEYLESSFGLKKSLR